MPLLIQLFGSPRIQLDGQNVHFGRHKALALLAYLVVEQQPQTREKLCAIFWHNYTNKGALAELRRTLSTLRKHLPETYLTTERDSIVINCPADLHVDVLKLRQAVSQKSRQSSALHTDSSVLDTAVELYKGSFMEGFSLADSPPFDYWQLEQDRDLQRQVQYALEVLAVESSQDPLRAERYWSKLIQLIPTHEEAYRQLMLLYHETGRRSEALRRYQQCIQALNENLGVLPDACTQDLYETIKQSQTPTRVIQDTPKITWTPSRFPELTKVTIGRQSELARLQSLVSNPSQPRCISIVGISGVGKTHLALAVARELQRIVYFFPLETASQKNWLQEIIMLLPFEPYSTQDVKQQLLNFLRSKDFLLIFDGVEHLPELDVFIEQVLAYCPHLQVLITTQRIPVVASSLFIELRGLACSVLETPQPADETSAYDLFVHLTQQQLTEHFSPTAGEHEAIMKICVLLQGLPLALEMAASWTRAMRCEAILEKLQCYLQPLGASVSSLPSMISLDTLFSRSWTLLPDFEQQDLMSLAIFDGAFKAETVYQIAQITPSTLDTFVKRSLISYHREKDIFTLHNLFRAWLYKKLRQNRSVYLRLQDAFIQHYGLLMMNHEQQLAERKIQSLRIVEASLPSIQQMWEWLLEKRDWSRLYPLLRSLSYYYLAQAQYQTGVQAFSALQKTLEQVVRTNRENAETAQHLLYVTKARLGFLHYKLGEYESARQLLESSTAYLRSANDTVEMAEALNSLGLIYSALGMLNQAITVLEASRQIYEHHEITYGLAQVYNNLAITHYRLGSLENMRSLLLQALQQYTQIHDYLGVARACNNLGTHARSESDWMGAQAYYERSLRIQQQFGLDTVWEVACVCVNLGFVERLQKSLESARLHTYQAYALFKEIGHKPRIFSALLDLADLSADQDEFIAAQRYVAEAWKLALGLEDTTYLLQCIFKQAQIQLRIPEFAEAAKNFCVLDCTELPTWLRDSFASALIDAHSQIVNEVWVAAKQYAQVTPLQDHVVLLNTEFLLLYGLGDAD